jgi:hypothetical protein
MMSVAKLSEKTLTIDRTMIIRVSVCQRKFLFTSIIAKHTKSFTENLPVIKINYVISRRSPKFKSLLMKGTQVFCRSQLKTRAKRT